jgi:hypothetical protein
MVVSIRARRARGKTHSPRPGIDADGVQRPLLVGKRPALQIDKRIHRDIESLTHFVLERLFSVEPGPNLPARSGVQAP